MLKSALLSQQELLSLNIPATQPCPLSADGLRGLTVHPLSLLECSPPVPPQWELVGRVGLQDDIAVSYKDECARSFSSGVHHKISFFMAYDDLYLMRAAKGVFREDQPTYWKRVGEYVIFKTSVYFPRLTARLLPIPHFPIPYIPYLLIFGTKSKHSLAPEKPYHLYFLEMIPSHRSLSLVR